MHVLQCLFVRGSNKNKGGIQLFQILQKETLFHLLEQPSALGDNLTMWPPSCTLQERTLFPFQFGQEGNISGYIIERRVY